MPTAFSETKPYRWARGPNLCVCSELNRILQVMHRNKTNRFIVDITAYAFREHPLGIYV